MNPQVSEDDGLDVVLFAVLCSCRPVCLAKGELHGNPGQRKMHAALAMVHKHSRKRTSSGHSLLYADSLFVLACVCVLLSGISYAQTCASELIYASGVYSWHSHTHREL